MDALCWNYPASRNSENYGFFRPQSPSHFHFLAALKSSNPESKPSPLKIQNRMFILGMGFVGQFFAQELKNSGWAVSGTCRNLGQKMELEGRGFDVYVFDANDPEQSTLKALKYHTHLLVSIPPDVDIGDPLLQHEKLLRTTLEGGDLQWLCYLSSTSVYGDYGGDWVDEDAINTIIQQRSLSERQQRRVRRQYTSRVHVQDIFQALSACIQKPSTRRVYNIVDNDPTPREEVFSYARDLVEKKWPGKVEPLLNQAEASVITNGSGKGD